MRWCRLHSSALQHHEENSLDLKKTLEHLVHSLPVALIRALGVPNLVKKILRKFEIAAAAFNL